MLISTRHRSSLLLVATLAVVAVVPIWQAAADITRQIDATSNTSPSHININDETHHDDTPSWSSGGIRRLRKKKKKNSMSRSKSHKSAKRPKAKEKKKNVFGNKDTTEEDDNNNTGGTFVGDEKEEEDTGTIVGDENVATCTQEQRQVCIDLDVEAGMVCTSSVCTLVEEGNFNCDTLKKEPLPQYEYTCPTYNPANPEGTCFNGVCSENCSEEDVAACDQDGKDSCVTKACTKGEEDGATVCGNVVNKADGTTCKTNNPCKEEGTCNSGVCIGGSDLSQGTKDTCGTDQYDNDIECCNGQCCPEDKPLCCFYLFTNDYTW